MQYTVQLSFQLGPHLRSLRKAKGLTQAQLGKLIGVGQVRVAEIEKDPSAISVDQFIKILNALDVRLTLQTTEKDTGGALVEELSTSPHSLLGLDKSMKGNW